MKRFSTAQGQCSTRCPPLDPNKLGDCASVSEQPPTTSSSSSERRTDAGLVDNDCWQVSCPLLPKTKAAADLSSSATLSASQTNDTCNKRDNSNQAGSKEGVETTVDGDASKKSQISGQGDSKVAQAGDGDQQDENGGSARKEVGALPDWRMACPLLPRREVEPQKVLVEDPSEDVSEERLMSSESKDVSNDTPQTSSSSSQNESATKEDTEWHKREDWCTACPLMGTFLPGDFRTSFYATSISHLSVKQPQKSNVVEPSTQKQSDSNKKSSDKRSDQAGEGEVKVVANCGKVFFEKNDPGKGSKRIYFDLDSEVGSIFCTYMKQVGAITKMVRIFIPSSPHTKVCFLSS